MLSFLSTAAAVTLPTAAPPFRLPMLPFDYADAMLPGETLQVALDEPAHHALLLEALHRRHGPLDKGCFGQLLKRDHDRASSIAPLLQITQTLPARSHASTCATLQPSTFLIWPDIPLECVGGGSARGGDWYRAWRVFGGRHAALTAAVGRAPLRSRTRLSNSCTSSLPSG